MYQPSPLETICEPLITTIKSGFSAYIILMPWYLAYQPISSGIANLPKRYIDLTYSHGRFLIAIGGLYLLLCIIRGGARSVNPVYKRYISSIKGRIYKFYTIPKVIWKIFRKGFFNKLRQRGRGFPLKH